jgi:hypothetical protein
MRRRWRLSVNASLVRVDCNYFNTLRRALGECVHQRCMIIGEECVEASRQFIISAGGRAFIAIYPHTVDCGVESIQLCNGDSTSEDALHCFAA